jgi:hypothetical protein
MFSKLKYLSNFSCCVRVFTVFFLQKKIVFVFYLLVQTGTVEGTEQTLMEKIEGSDSYTALLWGTMGTIICSTLFYLLQWNTDTKAYTLPPLKKFCAMICNKHEKDDHGTVRADDDDDDDEHVEKSQDEIAQEISRPLISIPLVVESVLHGMATLFPAVIVLVLAWATGAVMVDVGADRLFARWIVGKCRQTPFHVCFPPN